MSDKKQGLLSQVVTAVMGVIIVCAVALIVIGIAAGTLAWAFRQWLAVLS